MIKTIINGDEYQIKLEETENNIVLLVSRYDKFWPVIQIVKDTGIIQYNTLKLNNYNQ